MLRNKSFQQSIGFSPVNADELFFINGGSGSTTTTTTTTTTTSSCDHSDAYHRAQYVYWHWFFLNQGCHFN